MKKGTWKFFLSTGIASLALGFVLSGPQAEAGISGSAHDFTADAFALGPSGANEICVPCHTPHGGDLGQAANAPLWNHTVSGSTFSPYTSGTGTLNASTGAPSGVSLLCLSCHDGATALDAFGGATGGILMAAVSTAADFGTDLRNDHPISFTYDSALAVADGELFDPAIQTTGLGGTIATDMLFGAGNDQLECASCHDVHNGPGNPYLLRKTNGASALCLTCHDK